MLIKPNKKKTQRAAAGIFYTAVSALLFSASFPGTSFWGLIFVFLIPFLYVLETNTSAKHLIVFGGLFGLMIAFGTGYWLITAMVTHYGKSALVAIAFFSGFIALPTTILMALFALSYGYIKKKNLIFFTFWLPSCWLLYEYSLDIVPVFIPWPLAGNAAIPWNTFVQMADITGVYGLSYVIILVNALLFFLLFHSSLLTHDCCSGRSRCIGVCLLVIVMALPLTYGRFKLTRFSNERESDVDAVVVQGSFKSKERWTNLEFSKRLSTYLALNNQHFSENESRKKLILWPETILNIPEQAKRNDTIKQIQDTLSKKTVLIAGGLRTDVSDSGFLNTAFVISTGYKTGWYDKKILLPYAEYSPGGVFIGQYYNAPSQFLHGQLPQLVKTVAGDVGLSICFEVVYPNHVRSSVKYGAGILANISNDSWFGESGMAQMHFNISRLRAIENRRFLLRSSNNGISGIITPDGRIVTRIGKNERNAVTSRVNLSKDLTLYTRYGNVIVLLSIGMILMFFLAALKTKPASADTTQG